MYAALSLGAFAVTAERPGSMWPLKHDQVGYYAYLPALLTDEGLSFEGLEGPRLDEFREAGFAGFHRQERTGRLLNPYGPGPALLMAPFFAVAHVVSVASGSTADGFGAAYRLLAALSGAVYAILGLLLLSRALRNHFSAEAVGTVVVALGLGTNLAYYATIEPLMSHSFSFFAFSVVVWATMAWVASPSHRAAALGGLGLGLAIAIRPTNALLVLVPAGYVLATSRATPAEPRADWPAHAGAALAATILGAIPLFAYWRFASGGWFANPYGSGTFYPTSPRVLDLLVSWRKGWFVYTPLMLGVLPGLWLLRQRIRGLALPLTLYLMATWFVASSWWNWWYGGSFGMRAMIEVSAALAPALAATAAWCLEAPRRRRAAGAVCAMLIGLNLFQSYQYVRGYIHWDGMTRSTYWAVFGRASIPEEEMRDIRRGLDLTLPRLPRNGS